jgi:hypothetical protein
MQGIVNLARRYETCHIEQTAHEAIEMGLRSYKAFCRLIDIKKTKESQKSVDAARVVRQEHELIRPATDYGDFFDQYAAKADKQQDIILLQEQLPIEQKPTVVVKSNPENKPISIDLRPFLRTEPVKQQGVFKDICQYLGCGCLPEWPPGEAQSPLHDRSFTQIR